VKNSHAVQLLEITPDVTNELLSLEKIEITDEDKLPYSDFVQLESVQLFDGHPIKFLSDGQTMYLLNTASEMGGMIEYTYLVPLEGAHGGKTTDHIAVAVAEQTARRKKLLEESERICRGVAARVKKQIEQQQVIQQFEQLKKDAKYFIREGQKGYQTAQVQMLSYVLEKNNIKNEKLDNCLMKVESASDKVLHYREKYTTKAQVELRPEKSQWLDPKVMRKKASDKIAQLYNAEIEVTEDSELENMTEYTSRTPPSLKSELISEIPVKNHFEQKAKTVTMNNTAVKKGDKQKNDKSNSEGIERT